MRRQTQNTSPDSFLNLDPFIDIVTNVIGAFFFVIIYIALASSGIKSKITTPLFSVVDTSPIYFECRNQTAFFPDIEGLRKESNDIWKRIRVDNWFRKVEILKTFNISNQFYTYVPEKARNKRGNWTIEDNFEPIPDARGETSFQIKRQDSLFRRKLATLDPNKQHLYFIVRNDSFEIFHVARAITLESGFRVGWNPLESNNTLVFTSSGGGVDPSKIQ
jgi:hypothetical protein